MATLLLRLAAPMQSWGVDSKFEIRKTNQEPSKSGVLGLVAAALGRRRDEPMNDLAQLKFGVRTDQQGKLQMDFHTARKDSKTSYVTYRYYLSDGVFLAGLESDDKAFLEKLSCALNCPVYPLFLGRRSCPPTLPLCLGIRDCDLLTALSSEPWQAASWRQKKLDSRLPIVMDGDAAQPGASMQKDVPVSYSPINRQYGYRPVARRSYVDVLPPENQTAHDAMSELRN